jgi:hypothetical protein
VKRERDPEAVDVSGMDFQDKELNCRDCREWFVFAAGEQRFFAARDYKPPSRCPECRRQHREQKVARDGR